MQNFRQLSVWRLAHALALNVHRLSTKIPRQHNSGLISQLRRAALSVPANIAEGTSRESNRDFAKFLQIAIASASELEYHLQFSGDANLIPRAEFEARIAEVVQVRRMLIGLLKRVRSSDGPVAVVPPPTADSPSLTALHRKP
jgi:four helix bundle protein